MNKAPSEEEMLSRLAEEIRFQATFTVTPSKPEPKPKPKRKPKRKKKRSPIELLLDAVAQSHQPPRQPLTPAHNNLSVHSLPKFDVTIAATVFGQVLTETFYAVAPDQVSACKMDLQERLFWYVRNLHNSLNAAGSESRELILDLRK